MADILALYCAILHDRRNMERSYRRRLRDSSDPFDIPNARFGELFHLNKEAALDLLKELSPHMHSGVRNTFIPKSVRLTVALHFYATGSYLREVGQNTFCPVSKAKVCRIVHEVTNIIEKTLVNKYVKFPQTADEQKAIKQKFFANTGFPGVIGAMGCTHIKIKKPAADIEFSYRNVKGFFSKNVQLICDYDLRILGCYAHFGGSTDNTYIWNQSIVKSYLESEYREGVNNIWLLGDSSYAIQPWLMTPFRYPENIPEKKFNECHSAARNCIERLDGVLKKIFACLSHDRGLLLNPRFAGAVINVCCILHNFRKQHNLEIPDVVIQEKNPQNYVEVEDTSNFDEGRKVRQMIVNNYFS